MSSSGRSATASSAVTASSCCSSARRARPSPARPRSTPCASAARWPPACCCPSCRRARRLIAAGMPQHLPGVLQSLAPTLDHYGYLAVMGLVLVEDFGVPVPGETVLILAAVYAGAGRLNVVLVALLAFCAA